MAEKNSAYFQKLLQDRLDSVPEMAETEEDLYRMGTERVLVSFAVDRIRTGEYWQCVQCGESIAEERLLSDPTTLVCAACSQGRKQQVNGRVTGEFL